MLPVRPRRPGERLPRAGKRCPRCHRRAPRDDGIPCGLCAPNGREGLTVTDASGVTHDAFSWCVNGEFSRAPVNGASRNVGDVPIDCMECIANPRAEEERW